MAAVAANSSSAPSPKGLPPDPELQDLLDKTLSIVGAIEKELQLPTGLLQSLLSEDDWSFIIKVHALVEAAVSHQLAAKLDPKLLPVFQRLELGDARIGKVVFAEHLGLLDKDQRRFVSKLSELRNALVHNIRNVGFSLTTYIASLDTQQRKTLFDSVVSFTTPEAHDGWTGALRERPKAVIWIAATRLLAAATMSAMAAKLEKDLVKLAQDWWALTAREAEPR